MPIELVTGIPGSGKTSHVIRLLAAAQKATTPAHLFLCADSPELQQSSPIGNYRKISSRDGQSWAIDYFESSQRTIEIIEQLAATELTCLLIFEEAQYFGQSLVPWWKALSSLGHTVVISTPSPAQIAALSDADAARETRMALKCNLLADGDATQFFVLPGVEATLAVCDDCAEAIQGRAGARLAQMLVNNEPYPGQPKVYQPIDVRSKELLAFKAIREDSEARANIMTAQIRKVVGPFESHSLSYLDVGCNIGFFCKKMADLGFKSKGVDVVASDILVARLLDTYFYRRYIEFTQEDAVRFLQRQTELFSVASCFSVFQWLYLQHDSAAVDKALASFFRVASKIIFFEVGYRSESHYANRLQESIDRKWVMDRMEGSGCFSDVRLYEEGTQGLKRDFFVGIRS